MWSFPLLQLPKGSRQGKCPIVPDALVYLAEPMCVDSDVFVLAGLRQSEREALHHSLGSRLRATRRAQGRFLLACSDRPLNRLRENYFGESLSSSATKPLLP